MFRVIIANLFSSSSISYLRMSGDFTFSESSSSELLLSAKRNAESSIPMMIAAPITVPAAGTLLITDVSGISVMLGLGVPVSGIWMLFITTLPVLSTNVPTPIATAIGGMSPKEMSVVFSFCFLRCGFCTKNCSKVFSTSSFVRVVLITICIVVVFPRLFL